MARLDKRPHYNHYTKVTITCINKAAVKEEAKKEAKEMEGKEVEEGKGRETHGRHHRRDYRDAMQSSSAIGGDNGGTKHTSPKRIHILPTARKHREDIIERDPNIVRQRYHVMSSHHPQRNPPTQIRKRKEETRRTMLPHLHRPLHLYVQTEPQPQCVASPRIAAVTTPLHLLAHETLQGEEPLALRSEERVGVWGSQRRDRTCTCARSHTAAEASASARWKVVAVCRDERQQVGALKARRPVYEDSAA
ncbi:hypothetical protein K438DRAFT_1773333 [Mycena galopus ATCC 62051]|nr:hypothetical protein K438DRAFT_1773333 [Mycena galopus ATCC 62051]